MKYSELINFNPIETIVQINEADDSLKAKELVKSYVMSDDMADKLNSAIINELRLDEVVDNKGVLIVGNYGTGKSHLMSVISSVALDKEYSEYLQNKKFAKHMDIIAGKFEILRIEIGSTTMSFRKIILNRVEQDFKKRGLEFAFPKDDEIVNNKDVLNKMMSLFLSKYPDKGYLIIVDEFLDYLGGRKEQEIKLDLGFMRELGEIVKRSRLRMIFGVQEMLFDNPSFSFVSQTLNRVKDRFEQVIIRKEDTSYVVSQRILKKTPEQKAIVREHLLKFCSLYTNMSERLDEYIELFPIHPSYIDVFNKIYIAENRHILKNISITIQKILNNTLSTETPGIISFDDYWSFIKDNYAYKTDSNIKEVIEKSGQLEEILNRSFPKKIYKTLAVKIIYALSIHRLTTTDISIRAGLTAENLRDDLCLYIENMPELDSDFLQSVVVQVLRDVMTTVSGQFIEHNNENGQYYLDLKKDIDYDEKITQKASILDDSSLNRYFFDVVNYCIDDNKPEKVSNFKIYDHSLNWTSHNIYIRGYLFMGTPENRSTAQPPEDYYLYILPPYGNEPCDDKKKEDEVFLTFIQNEVFKNNLKLYAASLSMKELAEEKNKQTYQDKANVYKKLLTRYLSENKNTCFEIMYIGEQRKIIDLLKSNYNKDYTFKDTIDMVASICLNNYFDNKYPDMPTFKTKVTQENQAALIEAAFDYFAGRKSQQGAFMLDGLQLLDGDKITISNSKYGKYYAGIIDALPGKTVLNFSDVYDAVFEDYLDKKFKINNGILSLVFIALVHVGKATINLNSGKNFTASDFGALIKSNTMDYKEFKYISKPKDVALVEISKLFEILDIPLGLIKNPNEREKGLEELIKKTSDIASKALSANTRLSNEFNLWGEPLIAIHISKSYESAVKSLLNEFNNFGSRFNTTAKLNNFSLSLERIEEIEKDINTVNIVMEYDKFKNDTSDSVNYIKNLELLDLGDRFKSEIEATKEQFRKMRDDIANNKNGEGTAYNANNELATLKGKYIDVYLTEHTKKRLNHKDGKRKGEIINSEILTKLKRLSVIDILSTAKLGEIEKQLASLKVCYELTPTMLKSTHICPKCNFQIGEKSLLVAGQLESIETKLENLFSEWTNTIINIISDPLSQMEFIDDEAVAIFKEVIKKKELPKTIDNFFVNNLMKLITGFEPVIIHSEELMERFDEIGPCEVDIFNSKILNILGEYTKGKDKSKLRIIVKRKQSLTINESDKTYDV